jgi:hypothetical protein
VLDGAGWSIEFNHEANGVTHCVMLLVRGGGDPVTSIVKLCKDNGGVALDSSTGELLSLDSPSPKSWQEFQEYRDHVVGSTEQTPAKQNSLREHPGYVLSAIVLVVIVIIYFAWRR